MEVVICKKGNKTCFCHLRFKALTTGVDLNNLYSYLKCKKINAPDINLIIGIKRRFFYVLCE